MSSGINLCPPKGSQLCIYLMQIRNYLEYDILHTKGTLLDHFHYIDPPRANWRKTSWHTDSSCFLAYKFSFLLPYKFINSVSTFYSKGSHGLTTEFYEEKTS